MIGVLAGFSVIGVVIALGWVVQRFQVLGENAQYVLTRLVFSVGTPCMLFATISASHLHQVLGPPLVIQALSVLVCWAVYLTFSALDRRQQWGAGTVIGCLSTSYVNAGNLGIPIATFVLGDAAQVAPILLLQLAIITPLAMTALDLLTSSGTSLRTTVRHVLMNPVLIGCLAAVVVLVLGWKVPTIVLQPIQLLAGIAVPGALLTFGMSIATERPFQDRSVLPKLGFVGAIKLIVQPVAAFLIASLLFGAAGHVLFSSVVMAALPTAQNVFNYASRYGVGTGLARDVGLLTTIGAVPVLIVIALLLAA
ncbi:MAG: AEC family transporter [Pseudoclavibacter sp.]